MDDLVNYDHVQNKERHRVRAPGRLDFFRDLDESGHFDRTMLEQRWSEDYDYLLSHGYKLRPRFQPDWTPSWRGTDLSPVACEDSVEYLIASVIDAKRLEDGKIVSIKRVPPFTLEAEIAHMLSSPERLQDPMNHCVPVYDYFPDDRGSIGGSFIVMPLLRAFNKPPFAYVDEVVDFVRQTLEGLIYIHRQNVAHRDLSDGNILMDGRLLYGKYGFHPSDQEVTAGDIMIPAKARTRRKVGFVKYYFTDFGLSVHFNDPSEPRLVTGKRAQDKDVPELSDRVPYDPFAVDVFTLGMVYKRNFLDKYSNVDFLSLLCTSMTEEMPGERPNAAEALAIFQQSLSSCRGSALRWRLRERRESRLQSVRGDFLSVLNELTYQARRPVTFLLTVSRAVVLIPLKIVTFLFYSGPHGVLTYLRRKLRKPGASESQCLTR